MQIASLVVVEPNGQRQKIALEPVPFRIGRHESNDLVLRDGRTSRQHAQVVMDGGAYFLEDVGSRHGVYVNGRRVQRHKLSGADTIEFGVPDSYQVIFSPQGAELTRLVESTEVLGPDALAGSSLAKLKAILEIGRTLQTSYSLEEVLNSVLDAALAVTGADRGFLFLHTGKELGMRCARDCRCKDLDEESLRVPRSVLTQALRNRSELLSMTFRPPGSHTGPGNSIVDLELRSVLCVPLVRIRTAPKEMETAGIPETAGLLYLDSRISERDMATGNRELLQALAIEASVIIENARLLEEEREKKTIEEELGIARAIQQRLLPQKLPQAGWFRAAGCSIPSYQVGGDYYDVARMEKDRWTAVVADVSGKGVSSALVASALQGAFLTFADGPMRDKIERVNRFLNERTEDGKYATIFYAHFEADGTMEYINAGHCAPLLVSRGEKVRYLETTGIPAGLVEDADFAVEQVRLKPGDRIVIYSDGVTDAQNPSGEPFGRRQLKMAAESLADGSETEMHKMLLQKLDAFTDGAAQADDITLLVLQYCS